MVTVRPFRELMERRFAESVAEGYVYAMQDPQGGLVKIGRSENPWGRRERLSRELGRELELLDYWPTDDCVFAELAAHRMLAGLRVHGEWFRISWRGVEDVGELVRLLDPGNRPIEDEF